MKANEAPKKIYIHPDIGGREFIKLWLKKRASQESVEYTRTDAFIEKAKKWIEEHVGLYEAFEPDSRTYYTDIETMVKDFTKYMKGE